VLATCVSLLGILLVLAVLRDVVHELFRPEGSGSISRIVMRAVWWTLRGIARVYRPVMAHAGAMIVVAVAATWTLTVMLGSALVYWHRLPTQFHPSSGLDPSATHGFLSALYVSMATLTTLGSSDLTAVTPFMRAAVTLESLLGLIMITAWITWVLSTYPVIADRRSFAREVLLLCKVNASPDATLREQPPDSTAELLRTLSERVVALDTQLLQSPVTYYFQNKDPSVGLATQLPWVLRLAILGEREGMDSAVRRRARMLRLAIEDLLDNINEQFLHLDTQSSGEIVAALAADHLIDEATLSAGERSPALGELARSGGVRGKREGKD
jgi:hypothetical protein